jgi:hypothetical protein
LGMNQFLSKARGGGGGAIIKDLLTRQDLVSELVYFI